MRKTLAALLLIMLLPLTACAAAGPEDTAEEIQAAYAAAEEIAMTLRVTADYGERVYRYRLACRLGREDGEIEILEPASIAGLRAHLEESGVTLAYDGAEVYSGGLLMNGLSPVDAVPVMADAWRRGLVTECVWEPLGDTDCVRVTHMIDDDVSLTTWFDRETYLPVFGEFASGGYTVLQITYDNVAME